MRSLHLATAMLGLGLAVVILWLLRRDHLHLAHGLFWFSVAGLAAVMGAVMGAWPGLIDLLAVFGGISYPPALLFLGGAVVLLIKALNADMLHTRVAREVRRLNQRVALLELEKLGGVFNRDLQ